jgi:hypothetical protein
MSEQLRFLLGVDQQKDFRIYRKKISEVKGIPLITYDKMTSEYRIDFSSINEIPIQDIATPGYRPQTLLEDEGVIYFHFKQDEMPPLHQQILDALSQRLPQMAENLNESTWQYWQMLQNYAEFRKHFKYYKEAFRIATNLRPNEIGTVIDVGIKDSTVVLDMFSNGYERTAMDNDFPEGFKPTDRRIIMLNDDLFTYDFRQRYDIVMCQQVLEHLEDPSNAFSRLEAISDDIVVISVPYGSWHNTLYDPIDEERVRSWTGKIPELESVVEDFGVKRYIAGYRVEKKNVK